MIRSEIEQLLPEIFRLTLQSEPHALLSGLLDVMEALQAEPEQILDGLERYFNPYLAPPLFVYYLAGWVDLDGLWIRNPDDFKEATQLPDFPAGVGRLRELVARAAYLSKWRGTHKGMIAFLETATGVRGFQIDEEVVRNGELIPFHITVTVPPAALPYRTLIERIVQLEKPAYVTAAIVEG